MAAASRLFLTCAFVVMSIGPAFGQDKIAKPDERSPLRVLLFAGAATREYHFVRDGFLRTPEKISLTICLQGADKECDQYVDPERLLAAFPTLASGKGKPGAFDLVIAFDPDWTALPKAKLQALHDWVRDQGGGLVVVAGPVHSYRLGRPGGFELDALLSMMPVRLLDPRLGATDAPDPTLPHAVRIRAGAGALITLDKNGMVPTAGWEKFHWDSGAAHAPAARPKRGFYGAFPVGAVHPRAQVIAWLIDSNGRDHPFLVTMPHGKGRVIFLASGELWRLRSYDQDYHARMWWNLAEYATKKSDIALTSQISVHGPVVEFDHASIEAVLVDGKGQPIDAAVKPTLRLTPLNGKNAAVVIAMTPKAAGVADGAFQARVPVAGPGPYRIEVSVGTLDVSMMLSVKSYFQAHGEDRVFLKRQHDLARRAQQCAKGLFALSSKLTAERDPALIKEGKVYREVFDATLADAWQARHNQLAGAIRTAAKLTEFQAAVKDSETLQERTGKVRAALFNAEGTPPELLAFADAEEALAGSREQAQASIRAALLLTEARPDGKWSASQYRAHADELDAAAKSLREAQEHLKAATTTYPKKLDAVVGVRAETARYLKSNLADPAEFAVDVVYSRAVKTLVELSKQSRAGQIDANLPRLVQGELLTTQKSLDALAATPSVGALLVELTRLEADQARQTRALTKLKDRIEADLLKQLLDGK